MRALITDAVSEKGIEILRDAGIEVDVKVGIDQEELISIIGNYEALVVRSQTKVKREVIENAHSLRIIGRAGVGVDNIDCEAATEKGIIVVNAPEGNTMAATEHTIAVLAYSKYTPGPSLWRMVDGTKNVYGH